MAAKGFSWKYVPPNFRLWWGEGNHHLRHIHVRQAENIHVRLKMIWAAKRLSYMHPYTHWLFNNLRFFNNRQLKTERTERTLALIEDEIALLKEVLSFDYIIWAATFLSYILIHTDYF